MNPFPPFPLPSRSRPRWPARLLGLVAVLASVSSATAQAGDASWSSLLGVFDALEGRYLHEVDRERLVQGAIAGVIEALDDPFTSYAPPAEAALLAESRLGLFGGIGARFAKEAGEAALVTRIYPDLPAARAGLRRHDRVTHVDGVQVVEMDLGEVVDRIRGPEGEEVVLRVLRDPGEPPLEIGITRERIVTPVVTSAVLTSDVGYVRIETFENQRVHDQLVRQVRDLEAQGVQGLVLDLRGNGGGYLQQGVEVADAFLRSGDILYLRRDGVTSRAAVADPDAFEGPLVVLIDEGSASASEIVAAALQDHDRATIVGERSFGKGVGQDLLPLPDGGELKLVTFEWLRPSRRSVHDRGVDPDVLVEDTRFPPPLEIRGTGADAGEEVVIEIGGREVGRVLVDAEGHFTVAASAASATGSTSGATSQEVDPASDVILRRALEVLAIAAEAPR